jgi:hypothetical protein
MEFSSLTSDLSRVPSVGIENWTHPVNVEVSDNVSNDDTTLLETAHVLMVMLVVDARNCLELLTTGTTL